MGKDGRAASRNFDLFVTVIVSNAAIFSFEYRPGVNHLIINRSDRTFFVELISGLIRRKLHVLAKFVRGRCIAVLLRP